MKLKTYSFLQSVPAARLMKNLLSLVLLFSYAYSYAAENTAASQNEPISTTTTIWILSALIVILIGVIVFLVCTGFERRRRLQQEIEFASLREKIGRQLLPQKFAYASIDEVMRFFIKSQEEANIGKINFSYTSSATGRGWETISDETALEIYRMAQEAVDNAVKHSGCRNVDVILTLDENELILKVIDDGLFVLTRDKGFGLHSIRKRAESIGASIRIDCNEGEEPKDRPGNTIITLTMSLKK